MTELEKLYSWIDDHRLFDYRKGVVPSLVDLTTAIASLCGSSQKMNSHSEELVRRIKPGGPVILILIDGLGTIQLKEIEHRLLGNEETYGYAQDVSWLLSHQKGDLQTVFPSETTAALTTISTASWPGQHSMLSWWMHLDKYSITVESLPWCERFSKDNLSELGVHPGDLFSKGAACASYSCNSSFLLPEEYIDSPFSKYCRSEPVPLGIRLSKNDNETFVCEDVPKNKKYTQAGLGYSSYDDALKQIVSMTGDNGYIYWYIPHHDSLCHSKGVYHKDTMKKVALISRSIRKLSGSVPAGARIIVTGDHGHVNLPSKNASFFSGSDECMKCLKVPPFGGPSGPMFSVKEGMHTRFASLFMKRFGKRAALLSRDQIVESGLLGPFGCSRETIDRIGDFWAIFSSPGAIFYKKNGEKSGIPLKGVHGGLSDQEMIVPFIVI